MSGQDSAKTLVRPFKDKFGRVRFRAITFGQDGVRISRQYSTREEAFATALAQAVKPTLAEMIRYFAIKGMLGDVGRYASQAIQALGPFANKDVFELDDRVMRKIVETLSESEIPRPLAVRRVIRQTMRLLIDMGLDVKVPRFPMRGKDNFAFVTEDQAAMIVEKDDYGLFAMAVLTGLRTGELINLRWSSIDFEGKTIRAKAFKKAKKDTYLPLTPVVEEVLSRIPRTGKYVWWGASPDKPLHHKAVQVRWRKFKAKLGLPEHLRVHDLRASYATMLVRNGVSVMTAKALLRHANINTTMAYYLRFVPRDAVEAAMMLSEKLCDGQLVQGSQRSVRSDVPGLPGFGGRLQDAGRRPQGDLRSQGRSAGLCRMGV